MSYIAYGIGGKQQWEPGPVVLPPSNCNASQVHPRGSIVFVNRRPYSEFNPSIWGFYKDAQDKVRGLSWESHVGYIAGEIDKAGLNLIDTSEIAATCTKGTTPRVYFFWTEHDEVFLVKKDGDGPWGVARRINPDAEYMGAQIAAVTAANATGDNDVHFFASNGGPDGAFVHRTLTNGRWEKTVHDTYYTEVEPEPEQHKPKERAPATEGTGLGDEEVYPEPDDEGENGYEHIQGMNILELDAGVVSSYMRAQGLALTSMDIYPEDSDPLNGLAGAVSRLSTADSYGNHKDDGDFVPDANEGTLELNYHEAVVMLNSCYDTVVEHAVVLSKAKMLDTTIPINFSLPEKQKMYRWSTPDDKDVFKYPPHLSHKGPKMPKGMVTRDGDIGAVNPFDLSGEQSIFGRGLEVTSIAIMFNPNVIKFVNSNVLSDPWYPAANLLKRNTLKGFHEINLGFYQQKNAFGFLAPSSAIYKKPNIGNRPDWYSDLQFGQQHLAGPNPTTIKVASQNWVKSFVSAAGRRGQTGKNFIDFITTYSKLKIDSFYIQDYSYFRAAAGMKPTDDFVYTKVGLVESLATGKDQTLGDTRYGCASVVLFHLTDEGVLHPLAIVLDYKGGDIKLVKRKEKYATSANPKVPSKIMGSYYEKTTVNDMRGSVVVFNKNLNPQNPNDAKDATNPKVLPGEEADIPWRYAKMCVQLSDWHCHEVQVHLVNTHLMEEAVIVAVERTIPSTHVVYKLLEHHWRRTLPLNEAARSILVPKIINVISGMAQDQLVNLMNAAYNTYNWEDNYVPNDLKERGFPEAKLKANDKKFVNYPYAKNMLGMWNAVHDFVERVLRADMGNNFDLRVSRDLEIKNWVAEMRKPNGGNQPTFPEIQTLKQLTDAITMCITIAAPQHTAVNYLQQYYQVFLPNKPSCFILPLPDNEDKFDKLTEDFVVNSLPWGETNGKVWLLASGLPHLLNKDIPEGLDMLSYAKIMITLEGMGKYGTPQGVVAAKKFAAELERLKKEFVKNSNAMTVPCMPHGYDVMDPDRMAVSILI
ncbi:hypothetical protein ABW20_dc0104603 [Dactylellina cionopaga]|nr:hypothetical protein ABW20_dc0104603 [Dactylellina cionopaga]